MGLDEVNSNVGKASVANGAAIGIASGVAGKGTVTPESSAGAALPTSLLNRIFSANELQLLGTNGLIGENGLIGTNGVMSVRSYGGVPDSSLWKIVTKKPKSTVAEVCVAMNAILYRIECMLQHGIVPADASGAYSIAFIGNPSAIPFDVDDATVRRVMVNLPTLGVGGAISWSYKTLTEPFTRLFVRLITEFNVFCDEANRTNLVEDVVTPPAVPPATVVEDTIKRAQGVVASQALTFLFTA